jgi:hypothetical protein
MSNGKKKRANNMLRNGRRDGGVPFIRLHRGITNSNAWKDLRPNDKALFILRGVHPIS